MRASIPLPLIVGFGVALLAGVGFSYAASPAAGFGPPITGDASLNANSGALARAIAWQNSPDGDVFQMALSVPAPEMPFENVATQSGSTDALAAAPGIFNDTSLNANLKGLRQVIAWQQSPEGNAFQYALEDHVKAVSFERVALASIPVGGFESRE